MSNSDNKKEHRPSPVELGQWPPEWYTKLVGDNHGKPIIPKPEK